MTFSLPLNRATRFRALTFGVLALGLLSVGVGRGTLAYFTTSVASTANAFTAGSLYFNINDRNGGASASTTDSISFLGNAGPDGFLMKPGDTVYAPIQILNTGTLTSVYDISYVTTPVGGVVDAGHQDLAPALTMTVKHGGYTLGAGTPCNSTSFSGTGTVVQATAPIAAATPTFVNAGGAAASAIGITPAVGLPLAGVANDVLCFKVAWPSTGADNAYDGADPANTFGSVTEFSTELAFTFHGLVAQGAVTQN